MRGADDRAVSSRQCGKGMVMEWFKVRYADEVCTRAAGRVCYSSIPICGILSAKRQPLENIGHTVSYLPQMVAKEEPKHWEITNRSTACTGTIECEG